MCLILLAYRVHPRIPLVLAANRDEFYGRPSAALHFWPDAPTILAGRDLVQSGTWLGIDRTGRFAAVTNYREPLAPAAAQPDPDAGSPGDDCTPSSAPSRGHLVSAFLKGRSDPLTYLESVRSTRHLYQGFNLLVGAGSELFYLSNRSERIQRVTPGIHGLSNHVFDSGWPKVRRGISHLRRIVQKAGPVAVPALIELLSDRYQPADDQLPDTGVGLDRERMLAPIFITSADYGTRCSSVLLIEHDNRVTFHEQSWRPAQAVPMPEAIRCFEFSLRV